MIQPLVIEEKGNEIKLHLEANNLKPILWVNQGIFALIPIEVVRNELSIQQDRAKLSGHDSLCTFSWNQAIIIPPETGKVLAGE